MDPLTPPATSLNRFSELPTELRLHIWKYTLPTRILELTVSGNVNERTLRINIVPHSIPSALHANHESREETLPLYAQVQVYSKTLLFNSHLDTISIDRSVSDKFIRPDLLTIRDACLPVLTALSDTLANDHPGHKLRSLAVDFHGFMEVCSLRKVLRQAEVEEVVLLLGTPTTVPKFMLFRRELRLVNLWGASHWEVLGRSKYVTVEKAVFAVVG